MEQLKILVFYDPYATHTNTTYEHLRSFELYSKHEVFYAVATQDIECTHNLNDFDVIVHHYSVRLSLTWHFSPYYVEQMKHFKGLKVLFIQDEYDTTETARQWFEKLKFDVVYTCVPPEYRDKVYPTQRFPWIDFQYTLTGFVPTHIDAITSFRKPLSERETIIGYRGRILPYQYGNLGREKFTIAVTTEQLCNERNINTDISCDDAHRIYGENWYKFLGSCRATLGTESGCNVFDDDGHIATNIQKELKQNPQASYEMIFDKYIKPHEGFIKMNQISPRIFESIALRTALVLFEGEYSNVITPDIHYISLKKDFSNFDLVLNKLMDDDYVANMTDKAYKDIIESQRYSYANFIKKFDEFLGNKVTARQESCQHKVYDISENTVTLGQCLTNIPFKPKEFASLNERYIFNTNAIDMHPMMKQKILMLAMEQGIIRISILYVKIQLKRAIKPLWQKLPSSYQTNIKRIIKRQPMPS